MHPLAFFRHFKLNSGAYPELQTRVGSQVQHETPEEGQRTHQPKYCKYIYKDEDNNTITLNDKNYLASSQKFKQIE